jgi:hypothetical protein
MPLFGSEDDGDFAVQMNGHHRALFNLLTDFAEERELEDSEVLMLLVEATLSIATISYGTNVAQPTASGLRTDLDRLLRAFGESVRGRKKEAQRMIANLREIINRAEDDLPARMAS